MTESTVTRLRPRSQRAYTDSAALNDIHALLTTIRRGGDREDLAGDISAVLARTGRSMVRGRDIDTSLSESPAGWPIARVDAEDTSVVVRQDPSGPGLRVEITTRTPAELGQLVVNLDGRCLHQPCPPGGHAA
jgi:hypothetical protein